MALTTSIGASRDHQQTERSRRGLEEVTIM